MPDISMCTSDNCPMKETCYRYKAKPSEYQSYFINPPFEMVEGKIECKYYWEINNKKKNEDNHI